jgi:hypothetical protein
MGRSYLRDVMVRTSSAHPYPPILTFMVDDTEGLPANPHSLWPERGNRVEISSRLARLIMFGN